MQNQQDTHQLFYQNNQISPQASQSNAQQNVQKQDSDQPIKQPNQEIQTNNTGQPMVLNLTIQNTNTNDQKQQQMQQQQQQIVGGIYPQVLAPLSTKLKIILFAL